MTTIKQTVEHADAINCALLDAKNALDVIYAPDPGSPVERVQEGDKRAQKICQIMFELGAALRQTHYGNFVAQGLLGTVRVIRGPRAETVWQNQNQAIFFRNVMVAGEPHHVEIEVDVANACKKNGE